MSRDAQNVCAITIVGTVPSLFYLLSLQAGVLWHLLLFFFNYDYTLDEGGVEKSTGLCQIAGMLLATEHFF